MKSTTKAFFMLVFISAKAFAFLPGGKMENYSFREQSKTHQYRITGAAGYVSLLNQIFSAENAVVVVHNRTTNSIEKELHCDEITYELNNSYLSCTQGSKYLSFNLETE